MHDDHSMPPPLSTLTRITNSLRPNLQKRYEIRLIWRISVAAFKATCAWHVFTEYVGSPPETYGPSMLPTIAVQNDTVWIASKYRYGRDVEVGDMVSFGHPCVPGALAIKRVVGMPGDFVMRDVYQDGNDTMLQVWLQGIDRSLSLHTLMGSLGA